MRTQLVTLALLSGFILHGQQYTLSGYVKDGQSGEALIGATVYSTKMDRGTSTNTYGFYSISLGAEDSTGIVFSYLGYTAQIKKIVLREDIDLSIELLPSAYSMEEVVVEAGKQNENVRRPVMGVVDIPLDKLRELPVILGESDVLKIVQLLPGVQSGNEGTTGFHVRGGNIDQNLVQLDEATVYNPNHLFGLFSTFNSRALNNVTLIKGGFPAEYGGRLSSILDISMKEGNNRRMRVHGGIGLISSQLTVEGPIKPEVASFIVSGRRTYMDWLIKPFLPKGNKSTYRFYDVNAKLNWKASDSDRLFLSFFQGDDDAEYREAQGINYRINFGNSTGTLRWNHVFNPKLFSDISLIYNNYDQNISAIQDNSFSQVFSGINDWNLKSEFQYSPNLNHFVKFGFQYIYHEFTSSGTSAASNVTDPSRPLDIQKIPSEYFNELALYLNDEITASENLSANIGLRVPWFFSSKIDYLEIEPRLTLKYKLSETSSIKGAYTIMNQFLHLIPSSTAAVPTDIWIPSTTRTKPQFSQQWALGYFRKF
ncbi:MAG: TonB-dependent receptor [Saprospiraceae bacterium]|nr:TonB-dependent receptor [Saprospiraceae bacterium]